MLAILTLPVAAGLAGTLGAALANGGAGFAALWAWPGLMPSLWLSLVTGAAATAMSLAVVILMLAALAGGRILGLFRRLLSPFLAVPHAAAALGIAFLIAPSGWILRALSPWATGWNAPPDLLIVNDPAGLALTFGLVAKEVPFLLLMALAALPQADADRRVLVARALGYGRVQGFVLVVLPELYRHLRLPVWAVVAYGMSAVEMAMILGPDLPPPMAVQVVVWMTDPGLDQRGTAAAGAIVLLALVVSTLGALRLAEAAGRRISARLAERGQRHPGADRPAAILAGALAGGIGLALLAGLAGLALWSFAGLWQFPQALPESLGLETWKRAAPDLWEGALAALALAVLSTLAALVLVLAALQAEVTGRHAARPGLTMALLFLPLMVPQVAFLPGLQTFALRIGLDGSLAAVAMVHLIFVLPYVHLSVAPAFRAWDSRFQRIGAALGASPRRIFWRLRLPMLLGPVLTASAVGLAVSVGQYLPTLMIGGGRIATVTTEAVALSAGGNRRIIGAYALLQMAMPAAGFLLALVLPRLVWRKRAALRGGPA